MLKIGLLVVISKKFGVGSAKTIKSWHANRGPTGTADGIPLLTRLASASINSTVKIWDANNGECLQTLESHRDLVDSVAFCQNELCRIS
jgi:WD40 repeat protein